MDNVSNNILEIIKKAFASITFIEDSYHSKIDISLRYFTN